jgi:hypothetical protein
VARLLLYVARAGPSLGIVSIQGTDPTIATMMSTASWRPRATGHRGWRSTGTERTTKGAWPRLERGVDASTTWSAIFVGIPYPDPRIIPRDHVHYLESLRGSTERRILLLAVGIRVIRNLLVVAVPACMVGCKELVAPNRESAVLSALVPSVGLGESLPSNVRSLGRVSFAPEYGYSLEVEDTGLLFDRALFFAAVGQTEPEVPSSINAAIITARGARGVKLLARAEQAARQAYGEAPRLGCAGTEVQRLREVKFWRSLAGGVFIVSASSESQSNVRDASAVHIVSPLSRLEGAMPRLVEGSCRTRGLSAGK